MLNVHGFITSKPVDDAIEFGYPDMPIYVRFPDGELHELGPVSLVTALTLAGEQHDVIVIEASERTIMEAI